MEKKRIAVVGYGNIGKGAVEAVAEQPDMVLAGIVRRKPDEESLFGVPVVSDIAKLGAVDAAILCVPTRKVQETAEPLLRAGVCTVDSFDFHGEIPQLRANLDQVAKQGKATAVISAGWDPGSDSMLRALFEAMAPKGITYTNFGPGLSMGHSVAVRAIEDVEDALSLTIPLGTGLHRRMVYVQVKAGADESRIKERILSDPYFVKDETHVQFVEDVSALRDVGHGVLMQRKGVSGITHNQLFTYEMRINNPALTAQVMVACARAALRMAPGAYTMIEIPPVDLLPGNREAWVAKLV